jgi:excisionase family DNA binding protein
MIRKDEVRETSKTFAIVGGGNTNGNAPLLGRCLLSKRQVALAIGVSLRTIDNWMAQKRIPFIRLSARLVRFNLDRVIAALARYEITEVGARR